LDLGYSSVFRKELLVLLEVVDQAAELGIEGLPGSMEEVPPYYIMSEQP